MHCPDDQQKKNRPFLFFGVAHPVTHKRFGRLQARVASNNSKPGKTFPSATRSWKRDLQAKAFIPRDKESCG